MCDISAHTHLDRIEAMILRMDGKVDHIAEEQKAIKVAVFGTGTTKGLVTKVDDIAQSRKVETGVVSTITAVVVAGLASLGINFGTGQ